MKKPLFFTLFCLVVLTLNAQIYKGKSATIAIFSETPVENIDAKSTSPIVVMNTATGDVQISVTNQSLVFPKPLMQEHFNENYIESEKFPKSVFKGKINEKIDYTKDGSYTITVTGTLDVHGVKKERTIPGTLIIKNGEITLIAKYGVKCSEHNIQIPSLVAQNIADEIMVTFNAVLEPFKKP